jgi:hypothetical protein
MLLLVPSLQANTAGGRVLLRDSFAASHRLELRDKLRAITGWTDLDFDQQGVLRTGARSAPGGSKGARTLLANAISGRNVIVVEDASRRTDVVFCKVVAASWTQNALSKPPAFVVMIDFEDFQQLLGDRAARDAFDVAWGFLHELQHVNANSADSKLLGEVGECENHINAMRRELNLPERAEYYFTYLPANQDQVFISRFVRLAFDRRADGRQGKKRYWVIWDASVVGGLSGSRQIASR